MSAIWINGLSKPDFTVNTSCVLVVFGKKAFQITGAFVWQRRRNSKGFAGFRMHERDFVCMQKHAFQGVLAFFALLDFPVQFKVTVFVVTGNDMPGGSQMNADLVRASRLQFGFQ